VNAGSGVRTLVFTTLYPNAARPAHGVFVEQRLRKLLATGQVVTRVLAPVPWFPFVHPRFGDYARFAATPLREERHGILIEHPRYLLVPKIGMSSAPYLLALRSLRTIRRWQREGWDCDLIDAHYFFPDGVAATLLGKWLGKPVVVTARGSDINVLPQYRVPRNLIRRAARSCAGIVAVCEALRDTMVAMDIDADKISVLRNGVDLDLFRPLDRDALRAQLGWHGQVLLSVGRLIELKGHHVAIEALALLPPQVSLAIAGEGPMEMQLRALTVRSGVAARVHFLGAKSQKELVSLYSAADALVLASSREGMANVLLESLACGTPVIATATGGTPEVVRGAAAGVLSKDRTPQELAAACRRLFSSYPDRRETRAYAEQFSWDATVAGQLNLFRTILAGTR
jgi:teichuronic acid biosynthesis glycosyltransferase TuaC